MCEAPRVYVADRDMNPDRGVSINQQTLPGPGPPSFLQGTKIISNKGEAARQVGAWRLRCDTYFPAYYGSETSRKRYSSSQRPTREAFLIWVSETGSILHKEKDKWKFHLATHAQRALATNIVDA